MAAASGAASLPTSAACNVERCQRSWWSVSAGEMELNLEEADEGHRRGR
jgi:hypothetical protein